MVRLPLSTRDELTFGKKRGVANASGLLYAMREIQSEIHKYFRNQILNPKSRKNNGESEFNKVDNDRSRIARTRCRSTTVQVVTS